MSNFSALIATIQANIKTNGNEEITGAVLQDVLEAMVQALGTEAINNLETALSNEVGNRQNADGTLQNNIDAEALRAGTAEAGLDGRLDTIEGEIPSAASSSNKLADKAYVDAADTALSNAIGAIEDAIENGFAYAGIATPSGTPASGKVFYLAVTAGTYTNFGGLTVTQGINILKYNGTAWSQEQLIGIDNVPTAGSNNLVKSGGVEEAIRKAAIKEAFISSSLTNVTNIYVAKGQKVYGSRNEWYEGVFVSTGTGFKFATNIYDNENDALAACTGQKIYANKELTLVFVIDWDNIPDSFSVSVVDVTPYNTYEGKPIISNFFNVNLLKEFYIDGNIATKNDINYIQAYYGFETGAHKFLEGVYVSYGSSGAAINLTIQHDTKEEALSACTGLKIYSNSDKSVVAVIDWNECNKMEDYAVGNVFSYQAEDDCNSYSNKPCILSYIKGGLIEQIENNNIIKEFYVSPSFATYSDIENIYVCKANKIYSGRNEWYNGVYFSKNGGGFGFAVKVYNTEAEALSEAEGIKIYSSDIKDIVVVIDWGMAKTVQSSYIIYNTAPDYNSYEGKPIITEYLSESMNPQWANRYPDLLKHLPVFSNAVCSLEHDVNILMLGDSFFAAQETAPLNENAANLPPQCARRHTQFLIWDKLCFNKPQYDRFDSLVNAFTEVGEFSQSGEDYYSIWDSETTAWKSQAKNTGAPLDRYSSTNNASVSFGWDMSEYEKLNFIYRKSDTIDNRYNVNTLGTSAALVTIAEGNGKALVYNGSSWVEANGYIFSMRITGDSEGNAYTMPDVKLRFKKVTDDSITVTISNSANDGQLYYWGTERWNGLSLFITNIARGGFHGGMLQHNILNDIGDRECDLLIYESPLSNYREISLSNTRLGERSIIQGDGLGGWKDNANFKAISNNFTKFDLLCVIPHLRKIYIEENSNVFKPTAVEPEITYKQFFDNIRGLFDSLGVNYIPLYKDWIDSARDVYANYYVAGLIREDNTSHPNEEGCKVYASVIEPAIEI